MSNLRVITQQEFDNLFEKHEDTWDLKLNPVLTDIDFIDCNCYQDKFYVVNWITFNRCENIPFFVHKMHGGTGGNKFKSEWEKLVENGHIYINNNIRRST